MMYQVFIQRITVKNRLSVKACFLLYQLLSIHTSNPDVVSRILKVENLSLFIYCIITIQAMTGTETIEVLQSARLRKFLRIR